MKRLLYILMFLPLIGLGQYQTTNLDLLIDSVAVSGSDTLGWDSLTGAASTNVKFIDVDWDINRNSIPIYKTKSKAIVYGDTMEVQRWAGLGQRNINDADTLFIQSNDTAILRIAHYSTPTTDINNFFNALTITASMQTVCASGCDYTSWQSAITGATATDTIILYTQTLTESPATDKELTHIAIGNFINAPTTGRAFYQFGSDFFMQGIKLVSVDNFGIRTSTSGAVYPEMSNCVIEGTSNLFNTTDDSDDITFNNCVITGYLYHFGNNVITNRCVFPENDYAYRVRGNIKSTNDLIEEMSSQILLYEVGNTDSLIFTNSDLYGDLAALSTPTSTVELDFEKCKIDATTFFSNSTSGGVYNFTFDSCEFVRPTFSTSFLISRLGDGNIIFQDCYSDNFAGNLATSTKDAAAPTDYNYVVNGCRFQNTDTTINLIANNYKVDIENNTTLNMSFSTNHTDEARHTDVKNNTLNNTDSVSYKFQNGFTEFSGNLMDMDTSMFITFTNTLSNTSDLKINNNNFDLDTDRGITMISVSPTLYDYRYQGGIEFSGNNFIMPLVYGNTQDMHTFLIFKNSVTVKNNYFEGGTLTTVAKNVDDNPINYKVYGNVYKDCKTPIYIRSFPNAKVYNNVFYNPNIVLEQAIFLDDNVTGVNSDSVEFKNNIIDSPYGNYYYFGSTSDTVGFDASNNVLYNSDSIYISGSYVNYSTWTGLGYDANSYNSDPNLNANGVPQSGSNAIGNGVNLGAPYNVGISPNTTFPNPTTTNQKALWSIGAYVTDLNRAVTSNSKIIIFGNRYIKY
jgi:hypothetical protein